MSVIELNYKDIEDAGKKAKKTAKECGDYGKKISRNILSGLGANLTLGSSTHTNTAILFAGKKIEELSSREESFEKYAAKLDEVVNNPVNGAKIVDKRVKNMIERKYQVYKDINGIKVNPIYEGLCNLFVNTYNSNDFLKALKETMQFDLSVWDRKWDDMKYWYRCQGGKELVKVICCVVIAAVAVVAAVVAWPALMAAIAAGGIWGIIVAGAGLVGAIFAALDAIVDALYEGRAYWNMKNNRPADARWDSNTDNMTDWLNRVVSDNQMVNRFTTKMAVTVSVVELGCALINVVDMGVNGIRFAGGIKKAYQHGGWKTVWKNVNKKTLVNFRDSKGKVTLKSMKTGLKATQKYVNHITENRQLNILKRNLKNQNKFYKQVSDLKESMKSLKTTAKTVNKLVDKGWLKGGASALTVHVIDWSHTGKTTRAGIRAVKDVGDAMEDFQRIQSNVVR